MTVIVIMMLQSEQNGGEVTSWLQNHEAGFENTSCCTSSTGDQ